MRVGVEEPIGEDLAVVRLELDTAMASADHTDWADLMLALFRFLYQPNQPEQKGHHQ
jgi:hypothetical protein